MGDLLLIGCLRKEASSNPGSCSKLIYDSQRWSQSKTLLYASSSFLYKEAARDFYSHHKACRLPFVLVLWLSFQDPRLYLKSLYSSLWDRWVMRISREVCCVRSISGGCGKQIREWGAYPEYVRDICVEYMTYELDLEKWSKCQSQSRGEGCPIWRNGWNRG